MLAKRLHLIQPSATLAISAKANALKIQGQSIISLATGEPDFDTPAPIKQAAKQALDQGFTKYTAVDGIYELREAITAKFARDNQLHYTPDQVLVSTGAKQCLYNALQALLNPGDEVLIPVPYWVSYPDMVYLADGVPVFIPTTADHAFKIIPQDLAQYITPRTKLLILNSPNNPSGMIYNAKELQALATILKQHPQIWIISDDIYEFILWSDQSFYNLPMVAPTLMDRTLVVNGVSKAYAMTGWRIGYAAGPKPLIQAMKTIQSQSTSNPNSIAQKAALCALNKPTDFVQMMAQIFEKRYLQVFNSLQAIDGIQIQASQGTFYLFPNITSLLSKMDLKDDVEFCAQLLEQQGVALVPGTAFGCPGCIRLSFATHETILVEALTRLKAFCMQK